MVTALSENARDLERELEWFAQVLDARLQQYFGTTTDAGHVLAIEPPDLGDSQSYYAKFVQHYALNTAERLVVLLALIPHIRPQLLDVLWISNETTGRGFTEFGGLRSNGHGGFIPTGETAMFILAGDDLSMRFAAAQLFEGDHVFALHQILGLASVPAGEPQLSGALTIAQEYLQWFTSGVERKPRFNSDFPARRIETELTWDDLILPAGVLEQLDEVRNWILHSHRLLHEWEMIHKLRPGYTSLFYGPPGTGKTLSACLLGKYCCCDVYRIDLSMVVSKYIGETEKNLARVFDMAEHKQWILFFDEADALFGKRVTTEDANDRYANQEVSFLLQRIEDYHGVVILSSNLRANIDEAFIRRFQSVVYFPIPRSGERLRLWQHVFSPKSRLDSRIDLNRIAEKYELAGGTIMNVVRYSSLKALSRNEDTILLADVEEGIRRELLKEGRTV
jgi:hypothetical protein